MYYEFEACYHYKPEEHYNTGRGLSVTSDDMKTLNGIFDSYDAQMDKEPYAIQIRRVDTGQVVRSRGDMEAARKSSRQAWLRRECECRSAAPWLA